MSVNLLGRKIKLAKFHVDLFITPVNVGNMLPSSKKNFTNLYMEHTSEGVYINLNGSEALVSWANVQSVEYDRPAATPKIEVVQAIPAAAANA